MTRYTATIATGDATLAASFGQDPELQGQVRVEGPFVSLTDAGLDILRARPADRDGHVDDENEVWINGDWFCALVGAENSRMDDITWAALSEAGIDIGRVYRRGSERTGDLRYEWLERGDAEPLDSDTRITFSPAVDNESGGTWGWDVATYTRSGDYWDDLPGKQEWVETAAEAIALVSTLTGSAVVPR